MGFDSDIEEDGQCAVELLPELVPAAADAEQRARRRRAALVLAPSALLMESPASWISRLAFGQVEQPDEVMKYLRMWLSKDPDLAFTKAVSRRAASVCGLEVSQFDPTRAMLMALRSIKQPKHFLLTINKRARYRFCKACLRGQRTKHFPLHWRFAAWRWCPLHECLLEDHCPHCSAFVVLPAGLVRGCETRRGRGSLDQCMVCGGTLWAKGRRRRFDDLRKFISPWERYLLSNGRAVLASLYTRSVIVQTGKRVQEKPLRELLALDKAGLLPHQPMRFDSVYDRPVIYRDPMTQRVVTEGNAFRRPGRPKAQHGQDLFLEPSAEWAAASEGQDD